VSQLKKFYINGAWVDPIEPRSFDVVNPATEEVVGQISLGSAKDVDKAVAAARAAFVTWSQTTKEERLGYLRKILEVYNRRTADLATAVSQEMGALKTLATQVQVPIGAGHFAEVIRVLESFQFVERKGNHVIRHEPIGVCGFITPWNWPLNQVACKVAPALAAGCTIVLKPSEVSPLSAHIFAEIVHEAGVPKGVFNLVDGDGPGVGAAISRHPDIEMVSFTGSTRAGVEIAKTAAETIKRVTQELGGKSPNVILKDADLQTAVVAGVSSMMMNCGQSCNAPSRMLVPAELHDKAVEIAKGVVAQLKVGDPNAAGATVGPLANARQFEKVRSMIKQGIEEGATLAIGGPDRPEGVTKGYYVKPTIFANVRNDMFVAREEIFGPVLCILPYKDEEEAIRIANDTPYGLAGYVWGEPKHASQVASRIRAGQISVNGGALDFGAPFGGFKQSGNGREWGEHGFREFLEVKAVLGDTTVAA
jgi:aldehyde dehydrogenase (NAD+)